MDLLTAERVADEVLDVLRRSTGVREVAVAGSLRRMKETVGDIDILISVLRPEMSLGVLSRAPFVKEILGQGPTKVSFLTQGGVQVDVRGVVPRVFGAALIYFTGSKAHNIRLRSLAAKKGWKVNEYGLFDARGRLLEAKTESNVYRRLGLDFIAPEMREDQGEIEAAREGRLPKLITQDDIQGDLHAHTTYSDGASTLEEMARAAEALGRKYLCLTDHSVSLHVAHGLDKERLKEKRAELDRVNKKLKRCRCLFGAEVEIDANGDLDYSDDVLASFDVVVAAIHSGFKQSKAQLTRRLVKACENRRVHIIAHPTGRFWPTREPYDVDMEDVMRHARDTGTVLEINSHPTRLDLKDVHARRAAEAKVKVAINTDSHHASQLAYMRFGVGVARRGWLTKADVINTKDLKSLLSALKK
jgi:DNA polymerase (family X)